MRWEDERYVRVYTRDTVDWLGLSFDAQGLMCLLLRKVDRAGLLPLGKQGLRAVAIITGFPREWDRIEPALQELLVDGCVVVHGDVLVIPNFVEAQEATQSDAQRKRESRARAKDIAAARAILGDASQNVTTTSDSVTDGHKDGQFVRTCHAAVTTGHSVPSVPSVPIEDQDPPIVPQGGQGVDPPDPEKATKKPTAKRKARGEQAVDESTLTVDERTLVDYWRDKCGRPAAALFDLDIRRLRSGVKLCEALAPEYRETALRLAAMAIKGCGLSPHHQGCNDNGAKHNDLSLIFRDPKHVRMFVDIAKAEGTTKVNNATGRVPPPPEPEAPDDPAEGYIPRPEVRS